MPIARNETSDDNGEFKFLNLNPNIYSFYASKDSYYQDGFSSIIMGKITPAIPKFYMLPKYTSTQGQLWFSLRQDE
jgi:hypothetical protein